MNPAVVYARNPDFVQRDVAGECILVPIRRSLAATNSIYVLNETGAAVWNRIDGKRSVAEIADEFIAVYDVTPEQLSCDLETLFGDLLSINAVEEVAVAHGPTG